MRSTNSSLQTQQVKQPGCQQEFGPARDANTAISPWDTGSSHCWKKKHTKHIPETYIIVVLVVCSRTYSCVVLLLIVSFKIKFKYNAYFETVGAGVGESSVQSGWAPYSYKFPHLSQEETYIPLACNGNQPYSCYIHCRCKLKHFVMVTGIKKNTGNVQHRYTHQDALHL